MIVSEYCYNFLNTSQKTFGTMVSVKLMWKQVIQKLCVYPLNSGPNKEPNLHNHQTTVHLVKQLIYLMTALGKFSAEVFVFFKSNR